MKENKGEYCGTKSPSDVSGCRISLYPMSDRFPEIIMDVVHKIDTSRVWAKTDLFSTLYRGSQSHVVDCARAAFIYANSSNIHLTSELTFSKGCPGDTDADSFMNAPSEPANLKALEKGDFHVDCKYSFYVFGSGNYMQEIQHIIDLAEKKNLNPVSAHYVTLLSGTANDLFAYFDEALAYAYKNLKHYVLEATLSVNSPSLQSAEKEVK